MGVSASRGSGGSSPGGGARSPPQSGASGGGSDAAPWWALSRKAGFSSSSSRVPDDAHIQRMIRDGTLAPTEGVAAGECQFSDASIECPICFLVRV
jgi:hypothetical protein